MRRTRSSAASTVASVNGDEELADDLPPPSMTRSSVMKGKGKAPISRASMSSISTANDYATSSGYSTPATSAVTTPAVLPKNENASRCAPDISHLFPSTMRFVIGNLHISMPHHPVLACLPIPSI
jgi:hypothetical protein